MISSIPSSSSSDVDLLCGYLTAFGSHPKMFRYQDKVVVSTFAGEAATFGQNGGDPDTAWSFAKNAMQNVVPVIHILPIFRFIEILE
jgi:glucan endo-1,3-alpha-glucosidase